jgi:hypothetical protein
MARWMPCAVCENALAQNAGYDEAVVRKWLEGKIWE